MRAGREEGDYRTPLLSSERTGNQWWHWDDTGASRAHRRSCVHWVNSLVKINNLESSWRMCQSLGGLAALGCFREEDHWGVTLQKARQSHSRQGWAKAILWGSKPNSWQGIWPQNPMGCGEEGSSSPGTVLCLAQLAVIGTMWLQEYGS